MECLWLLALHMNPQFLSLVFLKLILCWSLHWSRVAGEQWEVLLPVTEGTELLVIKYVLKSLINTGPLSSVSKFCYQQKMSGSEQMPNNICWIQRFLANIVQSDCVVLNALALERIAWKCRVPKEITHYRHTLCILLLSLPLQQL